MQDGFKGFSFIGDAGQGCCWDWDRGRLDRGFIRLGFCPSMIDKII